MRSMNEMVSQFCSSCCDGTIGSSVTDIDKGHLHPPMMQRCEVVYVPFQQEVLCDILSSKDFSQVQK